MTYKTTEEIKISIIISSYNYEKYIAAAIESALAVKWKKIEVIVVDDGSSDRSRDIVSSYSDRIVSVFQENMGRVAACNAGFTLATGQMVLFLDSDDMLHPDVFEEAMAVWGPKVSKIQFQMAVINSDGVETGQFKPSFTVIPDSVSIRRWFSSTGAYPASIGSGNLYAKTFLDEIFPLDTSLWDSSDSCCLAAAPFYGPVETVVKPLVFYRIHGNNASLATQVDASFARKEVVRAQQRFDYAAEYAKSKGISVDSKRIFKSLSFAADRIVSYRLAPLLHPIPHDNGPKILIDAAFASITPQGLSLKLAVFKLLYIIVIATMPLILVRSLLKSRIKSGQ